MKKKNCRTDQCFHWKITPSKMDLDDTFLGRHMYSISDVD